MPKYKSSVPDPQSLWLKKYFFNDIYKTFKSIDEKKLNIFNKKKLINYLKFFKKKKKFNYFLIFQIYSFCKFHESFQLNLQISFLKKTIIKFFSMEKRKGIF